MLDHVSITVSDIAAAERFYDAIMKVLGVVKVGRRDNWLGYGERARAANPERGGLRSSAGWSRATDRQFSNRSGEARAQAQIR